MALHENRPRGKNRFVRYQRFDGGFIVLKSITGLGITSCMKITSKGQVTIPLPIRNEFSLTPGTDVEFVTKAGDVVLRRKTKQRDPVEDWLAEATGVTRRRTTTAKIMKLTRGGK